MLIAFLLAAALCAWILSAGVANVPPAAGGLALAAFVLEIGAPRLGRLGFFSLAAGPLLALAMLSPNGTAPALLAGLLCLSTRTLLRGSSTPKLRLLELLSDFVPLALSLAVAKKLPFDGSAAGYVAPAVLAFAWVTAGSLLVNDMPEELREEWSAYHSVLWWGGLSSGGSALVLAANPSPQSGLGTFLMLFLAMRAAPLAVAAVDGRQRGLTQRMKQRELSEQSEGLKLTEETLRQTGQAQQRSAADLELRLAAYKLVEDMLEGISLRPILTEVAQTILERLRRKVPCQTTVVFWTREETLIPLAQRTPLGERLQASALLHSHEPVVWRAHKLGKIQGALPEDAQAERIFPEESWTLAIPMRNRGVLYFGHPRPIDLNEDTHHFLQVLAGHSVIALEAADFYQRLEESLQREGRAASRNEALVQRLAMVIDGVTQIVHLRDPEQMLERTGQLLEQLIPHNMRLLWRAEDPKSGTLALSKSSPRSDNPVMLDYARTVCANGRPLLLEKFEAGRFPSPALGSTTLLAVPMNSERGVLGAVVMARQGGGAFSREDQDILSVLVYQLSAALVSAQLYKALKESQAQVVQSSKMAAVGQLAGGVAHELNTPLGAIALAIDGALVALHNKPERAESRLQRAATSVQQMKEIVSKLLFYSRDARSGRRETDLNCVIQDTLQLIGHQLRLDNVEVETELAELPSLVANQNELQQIFTNLCLNARDAVIAPEASQRKIRIATSMEGPLLKATVRDWGCGMPPEVKEKIFDPFFTTKDVGKGTGLGLSVTMELVQQHGGQISVESQPAKGTQFSLLLPQQPPAEDE